MYRIRIHCDPEPAGEEWPTLAEMQKFVGGYVEHVLCRVAGHELHMFVNEDGRRLGLPINLVATCLYLGLTDPPLAVLRALESGQVIVGNAWLWIGQLPDDA